MSLVIRALGAVGFFAYNHFVSHIPSYAFRAFYLRSALRYRLGKDVSIHMGVFVTGRRIQIGDHTVVNRRCYLDGRGQLQIGRSVSLSPEVYVLSLTHNPDDPVFATIARTTIIEDYVWVGARAIILPGVRLGRGCVIGAGSVVSRDIPAGWVAVGNPARAIRSVAKMRSVDLIYRPLFDTDITI